MTRSIRTLTEIHPSGINLAPGVPGCSEADLVHSMANAVSDASSPAGALAELRSTFPDMPLSLRIAALHVLMRRRA